MPGFNKEYDILYSLVLTNKRTDWSAGRFYKTCENLVWIICCQQMCYTRRKIEGDDGALWESDDTNFLNTNGQYRNLNIYD